MIKTEYKNNRGIIFKVIIDIVLVLKDGKPIKTITIEELEEMIEMGVVE